MEEQLVERVPLEEWEWMGAVAQKIMNARLRVIDHREIPDEDIPLLKFLFKGHYQGVFPIYETRMGGIADTSVQNLLFNDNPSVSDIQSPDGTEVVYTPSDNQNEEENGD